MVDASVLLVSSMISGLIAGFMIIGAVAHISFSVLNLPLAIASPAVLTLYERIVNEG